MNPDGREIPIVEDDMGEGYQEPFNENMTPAEIALEKKLFRIERSMKNLTKKKINKLFQTVGINNPVLKYLTEHK